jgi:hypothetical protein
MRLNIHLAREATRKMRLVLAIFEDGWAGGDRFAKDL